MSIRAVKWAWSLGVPSTVKLVLVALADHADEDGDCWPAQSRIAEMTGLTDRTVRYVMHGLRASELIKTDGGKGRRGQISLSLDVTEMTPEMTKIVASECASTSKKRAIPDGKNRNEIPKNRNEIPNFDRNEIPKDRNLVPLNRNEIPNHRTIKNHQEPSLPPKPPSDAPVVRVVKDERDMTFRSAEGSETIRVPDFVPLDAWTGYLEMRDRKKAPRTAYALRKIIGELERFHVAGHDVRGILDTSTMNGWKGVFEPKGPAAARPAYAKPRDALSHQAERMREKMAGWRS